MPRTGAGREERHPLGVIPVQVSQQQRSSERGRAEHGVQVNQAGPGVQHKARLLAGPGQADT